MCKKIKCWCSCQPQTSLLVLPLCMVWKCPALPASCTALGSQQCKEQDGNAQFAPSCAPSAWCSQGPGPSLLWMGWSPIMPRLANWLCWHGPLVNYLFLWWQSRINAPWACLHLPVFCKVLAIHNKNTAPNFLQIISWDLWAWPQASVCDKLLWQSCTWKVWAAPAQLITTTVYKAETQELLREERKKHFSILVLQRQKWLKNP